MKEKIRILIIIVAMFLLVGGVYYFLFYGRKIDIAKNPEFLYSENFRSDKIALYGIAFGDEESKINPSLIEEEKNSSGWIQMKNDVGYRISAGKVVEMVLRNTMIEKLGLLREDEIIIRFGEADKIEEKTALGQGKDYYYINRGLIVRYSDTLQKIMIINIVGK